MQKVEINFDEKKTSPDEVIIRMAGQLDINQSELIRERLLPALKRYKVIHLEGQSIEQIDLSFLQILHSFLISCKQLGIKVSYHFHVNDELKALLVHTDLDLT
ncbi:MAG: STAS domain-containing protein [Bacteroidetes bacterium]|nr:STAS domain-containing protein [Bacteroidota bacterium]